MNRTYLSVTKRLDEVLPAQVLWLSNAEMERFFQISDSKRKRDAEILRSLCPSGFRVNWKNRRGYNRAVLEVWWEFYQLCRLTDREEAIEQICKVMELLHESAGQRARRAC
ncbi:hypothetical protein ACE1CD_15355 [Aerosakkonema sp. BLCC-F183]|uniref:hypothetical protein n=1 Tax=Aerosakkonema sp. BLCC-F183 TaxID=3342834 RepID=UPI0035B7A7FE